MSYPCLWCCLVLLASGAPPADVKEELWAAARRGDAATVKALLDKGADVNARTPYGATALSFAADKGHLDVVKLLLDRKADVNAKDTFYNATPLSWALMRERWDIIKLMVEAGAKDAASVLRSAVAAGQTEVVRAVLDKAKPKPETLSAVLAAAKKPEIAELLTKAGAKPATAAKSAEPKKAGPPPDQATLKAYVGTYELPNAGEFTVVLQE